MTDTTSKAIDLTDETLDHVSGGNDEQKKRSLHIFTAKPSSDNDETLSAGASGDLAG